MFLKHCNLPGSRLMVLALLFAMTLSSASSVSGRTTSDSSTGPTSSGPTGVLDPRFGAGGKVQTDFGRSHDLIEAVAVQPDGKIVVAGVSAINGSVSGDDNAIALARYNSDGSLDPTFSHVGVSMRLMDGSVSALVLQPDGRILIAGSSTAGFMVARFDRNGLTDRSFGTTGVVYTNLNGSAPMDVDYAFSMALQQDGKIVVAGASYTGSTADFGLARYNSDGTLDSTFDGDGRVLTDFGASEGGTSIAIQPDGKIVMTGSDENGNFVLARYNTHGSLDTTFDGDGKLVSNLGVNANASQIAIQSNGKLVVAGFTWGPNYNFIAARYNTDGSLDTSFDGDGTVITDFGKDDLGRAMTLQWDGKIVVIGSTGTTGSVYTYKLALARYNVNGSLDTTFDTDGKVVVSVGCSGDENKAVALQPDGKIIVAGTSSNCINTDFALTRFNTNGSLDSSFHHDGNVTTDFGWGGGHEHASAVTLQADGKIIAVGSHHNGSESHGLNFALARFEPNGHPDLAFGTHGRVTTSFGLMTTGINSTSAGRAVAIQPDGKILVAGVHEGDSLSSQMALARYTTDGSLDLTFSADGKVTTDYGQGWAVAVQRDGKIIVAGDTAFPGSNSGDPASFMLARFLPDGSLDPTFDSDGQLFSLFDLENHYSIRSIAIQPNGKIVVAGFAHRGSYADFALARYNPNGSLDTTFDGDGFVTTTFGGSSSYSFGHDLVLQPDGKIVVAGNTRAGPEMGLNWDIAVARHNSDGSLDTTFDTDGKVITDFGNGQDEDGWAVQLQPDAKIVVAGRNYANFAVARYNVNGSLDTTFYYGGMVIRENVGSDLGGDAVLQPDGKIIVAGGNWGDPNFDDYDFALVRFSGKAPPGDFNMISPVHGSTGVNLNTTLTWESSALASSYEYCYDIIDDYYCNRTWSPVSGTSVDVTNLGTNTTYYWQVRASNSAGITDAGSQSWGSFTTTSVLPAGMTEVETFIESRKLGRYSLGRGQSLRESYAGITGGLVKISNPGASPILAAERLIYKVGGVNTSFTEMMALPNSQLDTTFWLPWYNNVNLETQLQIANVTGSPALVNVTINGTPMPGNPFTLEPGESARLTSFGVNDGPVQIVSDRAIVAAERLIYKINGLITSFSETMALPASQLDTTYWLPWYNNTGLDTQLRFANVTDQTASVHIYIGGEEMNDSPFTLPPGESLKKSFPGIDDGPVKIVSDQNIVVAERVIYEVNGLPTSFTEMMALPASQLDTTYWLPWYNNIGLDTQLRFANVSASPASVHVYIGGEEMDGSPFTLPVDGSMRISFPATDAGPVKIVSNVPIVAAERVIYRVNGIPTSFSEMIALPNHQLDTIYWLPWYNNVDLDTQLRFGVP